MLGELAGVAVGEEVAVDLLELLHGQLAVGAVLQEALVPLLEGRTRQGGGGEFPDRVAGTKLSLYLPYLIKLCYHLSRCVPSSMHTIHKIRDFLLHYYSS